MMRTTWRRAAIGLTAITAMTSAGVIATSSPASAVKPLARAVVVNAAGGEIGEVVFKGTGSYANRVEVDLRLPADAPGLGAYHGFHVHTAGQCTAPFSSAGGHWDVSGSTHGSHTGDLPSVLVSPDGTAYAEFETHRFAVNQLFDENGSAVIVHAGVDNFANIPERYQPPIDATTLATGDAGGRYGCGVVVPN